MQIGKRWQQILEVLRFACENEHCSAGSVHSGLTSGLRHCQLGTGERGTLQEPEQRPSAVTRHQDVTPRVKPASNCQVCAHCFHPLSRQNKPRDTTRGHLFLVADVWPALAASTEFAHALKCYRWDSREGASKAALSGLFHEALGSHHGALGKTRPLDHSSSSTESSKRFSWQCPALRKPAHLCVREAFVTYTCHTWTLYVSQTTGLDRPCLLTGRWGSIAPVLIDAEVTLLAAPRSERHRLVHLFCPRD